MEDAGLAGHDELGDRSAESLTIAVRSYGRALAAPRVPPVGKRATLGPSAWTLIFDTETTVDAAQQLRLGGYQVRELGELRESGIFYDPESLSDDERSLLYSFATTNGLNALTHAEFVDSVFFRYVHELNGKCVGFNLPFDISRIAIGHGTAVGSDTNPRRKTALRGGFTFRLTDSPRWAKVRVQIRHLNAREALIRFTGSPGQLTPRSMRKKRRRIPTVRGFFVDAHTLGAALTGENLKLGTLADKLGVTAKTSPDEFGGPITVNFLEYAVNDVQVTWECYEKLAQRYASFGLSQTPVHRVYSEASIGKGLLREIGIRPWREAQPDFPPEIIGVILGAYYGGRSEVRIRREIRHVLYCDFLSMYPTVCTLMGLWRFVTAQGIDWDVGDDVTRETQELLETVTLKNLQEPGFWRQLATIVQLQPDDDILPVRANYSSRTPGGTDPNAGGDQYAIGLNRLTAKYTLTYTLADCIASALLTGKPPRISKAYRFRPQGPQPALQPVRLAGRDEYLVDPYANDLYRRMVELRSDIRREAKKAGDTPEAKRLNDDQLALKIMANATSYGIFIELNVEERANPDAVMWYGPNGSAGHAVQLREIEEPGRHFHPLLATLITGAARLMLAVSEVLARVRGIDWVFCDTDSMALAAPPGMGDIEFVSQAEEVRAWFNALSPYVGRPELFKLEDQNFGIGDGSHDTLGPPLYALAVSAKRYTLFNLDSNASPVLRKVSGHGLGHMREPYDDRSAPDTIPAPQVKLELPRWQHDVWYRTVQAALGDKPTAVTIDDLPGFDQPAVTRYGATTPSLLRWFKAYNATRPYREQVRPFGFMYAYQPLPVARLETPAVGEAGVPRDLPRVVAPFHESPLAAIKKAFDRNTGLPVDASQLRTYQQSLAQYHLHPEAKFHNGDYLDHGLTQRRHVRAEHLEFIGKEANRWEEQYFLGVDPGAQVVYGSTVDSNTLRARVRECAEAHGVPALASASGVSVRTVVSVVRGGRRSRPSTLARLVQAGSRLDERASHRALELGERLDRVRQASEQEGLRALARRSGVSASHLSEVLAGKRHLSAAMSDALETTLRDETISES